MIPLWVIRYVLPGVGAVLALWAAYSWSHRRGVAEERGKWQAREVAAQEATRARETALQAQVDAAGAALSMSTAEIERLSKLANMKRSEFYATNAAAADAVCLLPDRLRAIQAGDDAANAAITAR